MRRLKQWGVFLCTLLLLGAAATLLFWEVGSQCLSVMRTGRGSGDYLLAADDGAGQIYVLGRDGEDLIVVLGDQSGNRTARWYLSADTLPRTCVPAVLYPASGGAVYLGVYSTDEETCLQLYRVTERGTQAELLLSERCEGDNLQTQMASISLSGFSEADGIVTFALLEGDVVTFYQRTNTGSGLIKVGEAEQENLLAALALSDGSQVLATREALVTAEGARISLTDGELITELAQTGTGLCYVDGAGLQVYYADFTDWQPYAILNLKKEAYDLDRCTDLWITRQGDALLLMEDGSLLLDRGSGVSDLTGMLYPSPAQCILTLGGIALGVVLLTLAVWYVVCEQRQFRLPLLVRWGVLAAAAAALGAGLLLRTVVAPASRQTAEREAASLVSALASAHLRQYDLTDSELPQELGDSLARAEGELYRDSAVSVYTRSEAGIWTLTASNTNHTLGIRGELCSGFDRTRAEALLSGETLFWTQSQGGQDRFLLYYLQGDALLAVDVGGTALLADGRAANHWMVESLTALAALLTFMFLVILFCITLGVHQALEGMERLAAGERYVRLEPFGGDEIASLTEDVNALAEALRYVDREQMDLAQSYRRFVPERVISLLEKTSIQEVDKHTSVYRNLAAMMLWFQFPAQVYERSGRELFDNLNEIIERTASIVTKKNGAVFNFAYNGYDAVFEEGSAAAVSTAVAVQQEVMEINRERELEGRPTVEVHIALDEGNVLLGIVGDENQIEPISISSSFSAAKHLITLCGRLEANILCTENVIRKVKGYGSRYMGKCTVGGELVRVYEIFDGDVYELRKSKEDTGQLFSEGVYALYGRDFSRAKRIFLELVHRDARDGAARYYLYLADRLEKQPEDTISLDSGR